MSALGKLVVSLALDHAQYTQGLDRSSQEALKFAQNSQKSFDQAEQSAKEFFGNVATGAVGVITSIVGIDAAITRTKQNIDILASLDDAAQKTGSSVEDLSRIQKTAKNFGDDFGAIEQSISRLAKGLGSFDDEGNQALRALDAIGVSARDSNDQLRTSADVYIDVAKSLQEYKDGAEKTAVVNALFGKSGADQLPILNNLARGIDDVTASSAGSAQQADEFNDALARSNAAVDGIFEQLAVNLLPTLLNIADAAKLSSGSFGEFNATSSNTASVLKGLAIAGRATVDVLAGVARQIGGTAAQLVALANLDFQGAFFIGEERGKDLVRATDDFNQFVDTVLNGDKKLAAATTDGGLKKTIDFALNMPAAQKEATQSTRQAIDASQAFMDKLQQEADQLGKTSAEIRKMQAAKLGLSGAADPLIDQIENETAAAKLLEAQLSKVKSITQANMTADERFSETIAELNDLMALPGSDLSPETYSRAVQKAQSELESSMNATKESGKQAASEWDNIWRTSENTARMAFTAFAAHGTSAMESIGQSIKTAIIDTLYQLTVRKWMINIGASLGMGGIGGTGSSSGGSILDSAVNLGSSAVNLFKFGGGISNSVTSLLGGSVGTQAAAESGAMALWGASGASGGGFASLGSSFGAAAGPVMAAFAVDAIGRALAGDKKLGGAEYIPVLGGFLAAAFGRGPRKFRQEVAIGDVSAEGFDGRFTRVDRAKGGAFVGNKHWEYASPQSSEFQMVFDAAIKGYAASAQDFAKNLGLSTDAVTGYSKTIRLESEKGKALTEEQITSFLRGIGNEFAQGIMPTVDTLKKAGEDSLTTLGRLSTEFTTLSDAATILGKSVAESRAFIAGSSFEGRTGFVDAAGGIDALNQKASFFAQNFLTDAERLAPAQERLSDELNKLNLSTDLTKDQFRDLVQSFGKVNGVSEETLQSLLSLAPAFVDVRAAQDQLAQSAKDAAAAQKGAAINGAFGALQKSVEAERNRATKEYNDALKTANDRINDVNESINKMSSLANVLKSATDSLMPLGLGSARAQIQSAINSARAGSFPEAENIQRALSVLANQGTDAFSTRLDFMRSQAQSASMVNELSSLTNDQLTLDQRSLAALEANRDRLTEGFNTQMAQLDAVLADAQQQIDLLGGINTTLLSIDQAMGNFNLRSVQAGGAAIGGGAPTGNPGITDQQINDYFKSPRTPAEIARDAANNGVSSQQIMLATGFTQGTVDQFFKDNPKIPRFSTGASFVPRTGLSIVERGERIFNTEQNQDLIGAIKQLVGEVQKGTASNDGLRSLIGGAMEETDNGLAMRQVSAA